MAYRKSSGRAGGSFEELDGIRSLALMWVCSFHIFSCSVLGDWKNFQGIGTPWPRWIPCNADGATSCAWK